MNWTINQPHQLSAPVNIPRPLYHKSQFPPKTGVLESVPSLRAASPCNDRASGVSGASGTAATVFPAEPAATVYCWFKIVSSPSSGSLAPIRAVHWWTLTLRTRLGGLFKTLYCYNTSSSPQLCLEANSPAIFYFHFEFRGNEISNYRPQHFYVFVLPVPNDWILTPAILKWWKKTKQQ